jgi:hypothetical protein
MKSTLLLFASLTIFLFAFPSNAQNFPYKCIYEPDAQTSEIARQVLEKMYFAKKNNSQSKISALTGVVKIPLVVHVMEPTTGSSLYY